VTVEAVTPTDAADDATDVAADVTPPEVFLAREIPWTGERPKARAADEGITDQDVSDWMDQGGELSKTGKIGVRQLSQIKKWKKKKVVEPAPVEPETKPVVDLTPETVSSPDPYRREIEKASDGRNTVLYDARGNPSVMVVIPSFQVQDIHPDLGSGIHPAFLYNGKELSEIFVGRFLGSLSGNAAVSMPDQDPAVDVTLEQAWRYCNVMGPGWHLMTNAEWAALALLSYKSGAMPRGNTDYGRAHDQPDEMGVRADGGEPGTYHTVTPASAQTLTGTGPASWNHDNTPFGVSDLVGNVCEWVGGLRLFDGEINIVPHNNAADYTLAPDPYAAYWHGIMENNDLMPPGTPNAMKYDSVFEGSFGNIGPPIINYEVTKFNDSNLIDDGYASCMFSTLLSVFGVSIPWSLKQLALYPPFVTLTELGRSGLWVRNYGERIPFRGGNYQTGDPAAIFSLDLTSRRDFQANYIGFRPAYVDPS